MEPWPYELNGHQRSNQPSGRRNVQIAGANSQGDCIAYASHAPLRIRTLRRVRESEPNTFGDPRSAILLLCYTGGSSFCYQPLEWRPGNARGAAANPYPYSVAALELHLEMPSQSTRGEMANHERRESQEGNLVSSYKPYKPMSCRSPNLFIFLTLRLLGCSSPLLGVEQAAYIL